MQKTDIARALLDPNLLGAALGDPSTWRPSWLTVLKATNGLPLDEAEAAFFASVSGGRKPPSERVRELLAILGRRSGKSRIAAALAVYEATMREHKLAPGEIGVILVLSASKAQARTVFSYAQGFLESSPLLAQELLSATAGEIRLRGGIVIEIHPNDYRTVRGRTILHCIFDEASFWRDETSANPAKEVFRAVLPALAAANGQLVIITTPYRRDGLVYEHYKKSFGVDDDETLVIQGASTLFNPTLPTRMIARAMEEDSESAESEWNAQFRSDICGFLDDELLAAAVDWNRPRELAPRRGISYSAFIDASGGRSDSYVCCIGHKHDDRFHADVVRGVAPPFDPQQVTKQFAMLVREYGCRKVTGDNYSAEWVASAWRDHGLTYERSDLPASALYLEALPMFARGAVSIPDHQILIRELRQLERRTSRIGKDSVTHPPGAHDDHANALAGCIRTAMKPLLVMTKGSIRGGW